MSDRHIVESFDAELQRLAGEIASMGEAALKQVEAAVSAFKRCDREAAQRVIDGDDPIDQREHEISREVLRLLALRQPGARDLREVLAALRIASDVERVGDYAVNIAKHSLALGQPLPESSTGDLALLLRMAVAMVRDALQAWRDQDVPLARAVWRRDDEVDAAYAALCRHILTDAGSDAGELAVRTHLLFAAKDLERIGDHATNIAESVWFAAEGEPMWSYPRHTDAC